MEFSRANNIFFLGIGGIGMSALARYCNAIGKNVSGYDRTSTKLTNQLESEGISIHFQDDPALIQEKVRQEKDDTLVVRTPAIPQENLEFTWFRKNNYETIKRSELLGHIANELECLAVAGTHGKTTISSILSHILKNSGHGCSAFLGGVTVNYGTNVLIDSDSTHCVVEADEFDRSFHKLKPQIAVISSLDADHLDIYHSHEDMVEAFQTFVDGIKNDGTLICKSGLPLEANHGTSKSYSITDQSADFFGENIRVEAGQYAFDVVAEGQKHENIKLGLPGRHNVENAVAAGAVAHELGVSWNAISAALESFQGVVRRFEIRVKGETTYVDDYAHHPTEIRAAINSAHELFPNKKVTVIFQPHLFSRTNDFADDFAKALELADEIILLPIYPAREKPIPGVDSQMLLNKINSGSKILVQKNELLDELKARSLEVLMTLGAGDIDQFVEPIENLLVK